MVFQPNRMPNDGDLVNMLLRLVPDEAQRNRILVQNPQRLFDSDATNAQGGNLVCANWKNLAGAMMRAGLLMALICHGAAPAFADSVEDFYRGKTITLVIGVGDGGF